MSCKFVYADLLLSFEMSVGHASIHTWLLAGKNKSGWKSRSQGSLVGRFFVICFAYCSVLGELFYGSECSFLGRGPCLANIKLSRRTTQPWGEANEIRPFRKNRVTAGISSSPLKCPKTDISLEQLESWKCDIWRLEVSFSFCAFETYSEPTNHEKGPMKRHFQGGSSTFELPQIEPLHVCLRSIDLSVSQLFHQLILFRKIQSTWSWPEFVGGLMIVFHLFPHDRQALAFQPQ